MPKNMLESQFVATPLLSEAFRRAREIDPFVHPFNKESLQRIDMKIQKSTWGSNKGEIEFEATIWFTQGSSRGTHDIKGNNLQNLIDNINAFLATLA